MTTRSQLVERARRAIEPDEAFIYDVATEHCQIAANVWGIRFSVEAVVIQVTGHGQNLSLRSTPQSAPFVGEFTCRAAPAAHPPVIRPHSMSERALRSARQTAASALLPRRSPAISPLRAANERLPS